MCLEIINRLTKWVDRPDGINITTFKEDENCNVIYKHIIQPYKILYSDKNNNLSKTLNISSKYPIRNEIIFDGSLFDFSIKLDNILEKNA